VRGQSRKPTRRRPTFGSTATRQGGVAFRDRDRAARTCAKTCIAESLILLTAPMRGEPVAVTSAMTAGMGDGEVSVGERLGAERRMRRRQSRKKNEHTPRLSAVTSPTDASSRADARARRWHQRGACEWDARVPLPNAIRPSPASRRGGPHPTLGGTLARWRSTRGGSAETRAARPRDRGRDGSFASALSMRSGATRRVRRSREAMGVPVS